jgi:hypothetical protein
MGNSQHLLRVEGVNHAPVLDDTDDISTRRGGSAMLRDAPAALAKHFHNLETVSLEASVALFEVTTDDPDGLVRCIAAHLVKHFPHITFVVDSAPLVDDDFAGALREVTARNRFRQFRQPTVAVPEPTGGHGRVCELDRLRPAATEIMQGDKKRHISASVDDRRDWGREQRKHFLHTTLELDAEVATTSNLVDLADDGSRRFGNLGGKMAVIYADGNGFGGIKRGLLDNRNALHDFDTRVQTLHKVFLGDLVESTRHDEDFHNGKDLRLEVLLWGGDELMLVTPAWKGMETLQRFFETVEEETPAQNLAEAAHKPALTYAAGLVFCSANTPIAEIVRTAKQLAEAVKEVEHSKSRFDYLVLESVDYPTQSIEQFRTLHFGANASKALWPLAPLTSGSRREGIVTSQ